MVKTSVRELLMWNSWRRAQQMGGDHNESVIHYMLFGIIITNPDILLNSNQQYGENCISLSVHDINDFAYLAPKHSLQYVCMCLKVDLSFLILFCLSASGGSTIP